MAADLQGLPLQEATYMADDVIDDRPDDSNAPRHANSIAEETSATGQRVKGAIKEEVGDALDDEAMEEKGARENEAGRDRQRRNDGV
ncbi:MAG TPA: CsbD family protein [Vicinamibacterales bacterium]|nr:CsbD family protein [Vicinamibacterales bacterium]